ncbi:bifunctional phosphopantothenoylcysteine decarboxylase/phosphopantothenate--cysteine ligase CoaBC [Caldalkalibacillus salinus]|uniref:bifunctional phosphopantothenoylcysteine decarboxylase/phosphopantothenate--cysteine ligase CoaBC n=1 Tax=Caldalkalibacillus salinus TaxID=2803787 RepID=UPI001923D38F|nr:bifunctional phosphopantothenoylcysteine decarboxylase/phosphopantothenate--cysteine ligase CoaBC [Caldalkalibacillus salinus]
MSVEGKLIVLGVSGGIAAYKAATVCSQLKQKGADVRVIMTESATKFVQPLTFQALSRHHVYTDTFEEADPSVVSHIDLADHADLFLVAPATANVIAKLANGQADDMLSTTLLATQAPVWMAPAMNGHMYDHPAVQDNMNTIRNRGVKLIAPGEGLLACGYVGKGRLPEPNDLIQEVEAYFSRGHETTRRWWGEKKVLVTAGPTRENLDPVRYISNYSSGKMGYALAQAAAEAGAKVTLVSGPVSLTPPPQVEVINVTSTQEMYEAVSSRFEQVDVVIKAAAVVDYQPAEVAEQKIKKAGETMTLQLTKTKDILKTLGARKTDQILVGFAAETTNIEEHASQKLEKKNLDYIVVNDVTQQGAGFGTDTNIAAVLHRSGTKETWSLRSKAVLAHNILGHIAEQEGKR